LGDKTGDRSAGRRPNQQGSLKVTSYGVTARIRLDGRRRERRFKTRSEAERWLEEQAEARNRSPEVTGNWTVAEWLEEWLQGVAVMGQRRGGRARAPRTIDSYAWRMEHYVLPTLGQRQLKRLDRRTLEWLWSDWSKKGVGGNTIADAARTFSQALEAAVARGILPTNPASGVELPSRPRREVRQPLLLEEWRRVMDATESEGDQVRIGVWLAGAMGLRRGEIAGLTWEHVHLNETPAWLEIETNSVRVRGRGVVFGDPKSEHSRRELVIPAMVVPHLQELRERSTTDLVLVNARGDRVDPRDLGNRSSRYLHAQVPGLPEGWGLHGLRHTVVTLVGLRTNLGHPIQRYYFGHSGIPAAAGDAEAAQSMTLRVYTHGSAPVTEVVAEAIERLYAAAKSK
jgi:integrase